MGRWQPYLYNAPTRDSIMDVPDQFNPKAVTMASRTPPSPSKKKQDGPLMNLNQHPDSYLMLPYGKTNTKPMNPKVKIWVKAARWIQFFFRVLTLFGAVGVLLCAIFIKGAQDTEGYVMRITPSIDLVTTLYAIYHLLRAAKARPAASSASYHFFALATDAGFIPFYVFTCMLAKRNSDSEAGTVGRWRTFFPTDEDTDKVLVTTWLTATTVAGLHCIALGLDLYLLLIFRKISRLPPDMNPLEDNLTSRRKTKHKHKSSSISAIQPLTAEEKRFSAQSGTTTIVGSRNSVMDPLMAGKDIPAPDEKKMAFIHTRTNSTQVYSPHTPKTAEQSRNSVYAQSQAAQSRRDLNTREDLHRRDDTDDEETLAQRKTFLAQKAIKRSSRPGSFVSSNNGHDFYTPPTTAQNHDASGDLSQRSSRDDIQSDNWFVHPDEPMGQLRDPAKTVKASNSAYAPLPYAVEEHDPFRHDQYDLSPTKPSLFTPKKAQGYNTVSTSEDQDIFSDDEGTLSPAMVPQPLRMNPPTPPPQQSFYEPPPQNPSPIKSFHTARNTPPPHALQRTMTTTSISTTSTYSHASPTRTGTPKSRYYGDLKAATQGVKGTNSPSASPNTSPTKSAFGSKNLPSSARQYAVNPVNQTPPKSYGINLHSPARSPAKGGYTTNAPARAYAPALPTKMLAKNSPMSLDKKTYTSIKRTGEASYTPVQSHSPRVVSRTGVDYMDNSSSVYDDYDEVSDLGSGRRDVSGKVAEEGRGGRWGGMRGLGSGRCFEPLKRRTRSRSNMLHIVHNRSLVFLSTSFVRVPLRMKLVYLMSREGSRDGQGENAGRGRKSWSSSDVYAFDGWITLNLQCSAA